MQGAQDPMCSELLPAEAMLALQGWEWYLGMRPTQAGASARPPLLVN